MVGLSTVHTSLSCASQGMTTVMCCRGGQVDSRGEAVCGVRLGMRLGGGCSAATRDVSSRRETGTVLAAMLALEALKGADLFLNEWGGSSASKALRRSGRHRSAAGSYSTVVGTSLVLGGVRREPAGRPEGNDHEGGMDQSARMAPPRRKVA